MVVAIDFETKAIVGNPLVNPPEPVGVAIWDRALGDPEYCPIDEHSVARLKNY